MNGGRAVLSVVFVKRMSDRQRRSGSSRPRSSHSGERSILHLIFDDSFIIIPCFFDDGQVWKRREIGRRYPHQKKHVHQLVSHSPRPAVAVINCSSQSSCLADSSEMLDGRVNSQPPTESKMRTEDDQQDTQQQRPH